MSGRCISKRVGEIPVGACRKVTELVSNDDDARDVTNPPFAADSVGSSTLHVIL